MTLTLHLNGKEKTFVTDFVSARMLRKTIDIAKTINFEDISVEELDKLVLFLVDLYGKVFTVDDVYDGLASSDLLPVITQSIQQVVHGLNEATSDPSAKAGQGKNG